jgi:RNase P subunit RPR2
MMTFCPECGSKLPHRIREKQFHNETISEYVYSCEKCGVTWRYDSENGVYYSESYLPL